MFQMNWRAVNDGLELQVGNYCARVVSPTDPVAFDACLRLRYEYFVQKRGWVKPDVLHPGIERDRYDVHALHLAIYENDNVIVYLRLLRYEANVGFMLNNEFKCLLGNENLCLAEGNTIVELSRLVCRDDVLKTIRNKDEFHPLELLLKLLYMISKSNGFARFYIVVEETWLKPFARRFGLPFCPIGIPLIFPDGTRTVAATATMEELEIAMERHSRDKHKWYRQALEHE